MIDNRSKGENHESSDNRALTILGVILCVILLPILTINCTLLIKGALNTDEIPSIGGIFPMIVLSDSMYPEFAEGDLIFCQQIEADQVQLEDVISYFDPASKSGSVVTHRVQEITSDAAGLLFHTKGDFNDSADTTPIPESKLVGVYTGFRIPGAGTVAMFMQTTPGLIVCVALPIVLLVGYDVVRRKMYEKKHAQDKDQLLAELEELRKLKQEMAVQNGGNSRSEAAD